MRQVLRAVLRSRAGLLGWVLLLVFVAAALLGPQALHLPSPIAMNLRARSLPPTLRWDALGAHPLGTDQLGRDILSRIVTGSRVTLTVGASAVLLGGAIGVALGIVAGYLGGIVDRVLMRLVDMQMAIPLMLLALTVVAAVGPSLRNLVIVLALTSWVRYARIIRGAVLSLRQREFVQSARAIGAGGLAIMLRHILPNVLTPALIIATLELARVVILEASLSFLGLGIQPPAPSWGSMLAEGRTYLSSAWWITTFPGVAILLTVLGVNLVGDWLRDQFDPRLRT
jgi:peptide/nickel transport system permease protein